MSAASGASQAIRVLLADDQPLARLGHALSLGSDPGLRVIGEAGSGEEALTLAGQLRPDVVLMDVRMPGIGGIAATRAILAAVPGTRVIVLTSFDLDRFAFAALSAGASAFLLKTATPEQLVDAVHTVHAGHSVVAPRVTRRLIEHFTAGPPPAVAAGSDDPGALSVLSPRELDVFLAVALGLTNGEIADRLFLSPATVKTHINRIFAKLHLRDRVQAVLLAQRLGVRGDE